MVNIFYLGAMDQPANRGFVYAHMPENINGDDIPDMFTNKKLFMAILDCEDEIGDVLCVVEKMFSNSIDCPDQNVPEKDEAYQNVSPSTTEQNLRMIFVFPGLAIRLLDECERVRMERILRHQLGLDFPKNWITHFPAIMYANLYPGLRPCQTALQTMPFSRNEDSSGTVSSIGLNQFLCKYMPFMINQTVNGRPKMRVKWFCVVHEDPRKSKDENIEDDGSDDQNDPTCDQIVPSVEIIDDEDGNEINTSEEEERVGRGFGTTRMKQNHITFKLVLTIKQTTKDRSRNKMKWKNLCGKVASQSGGPKVVIV